MPRRAGAGRPAHVPNDASKLRVKIMAAGGVPQAGIAATLDINEKTLRQHYRDVLDLAAHEVGYRMMAAIYRIASGDSRDAVVAAKYWLNCRMGWKETAVSEFSGGDQPIAISFRWADATPAREPVTIDESGARDP